MLSIHISIVHFSIVGIVLGTLLLLYSVVFKKGEILKVCLLFLAILSVSVAICAKTGEDAEHSLEELIKGSKCEGIFEHTIHEHEEMAEKTVPIAIGTAVILLVAFFTVIKNHSKKNITVIIALILCIATSVMISITGRLGGEISHHTLNPEHHQCLK